MINFQTIFRNFGFFAMYSRKIIKVSNKETQFGSMVMGLMWACLFKNTNLNPFAFNSVLYCVLNTL